ncbi:MAG: hypothetical protein HQL20_00305 [Candidatus Omnitrophica bacterium]|nr:hypothetical protein [Candidatus Omnitrophota bacterium]
MNTVEVLRQSAQMEVVYAECLTLPWILRALPSLMADGRSTSCIYFFDATLVARLLAAGLSVFGRVRFEKLHFEAMDVRDEEGLCIFIRLLYQDLALLRGIILEEHRAMFTALENSERLGEYLLKAPVCSYDFYGHRKYSDLWHVLMLVQVACWHARREGHSPRSQLVIFTRPFASALEAYSCKFGVDLRMMGRFQPFSPVLQNIFLRFSKFNVKFLKGILRDFCVRFSRCRGVDVVGGASGDEVRMMAEYYGQLNLERSGLVSDLFFLDDNGIRGKDVCLVFNGSQDPVDEQKSSEMCRHGVSAVALTPQSSLVSEDVVPVFRYVSETAVSYPEGLSPEWVEHAGQYARQRAYWGAFFRRYNLRMWYSWTKYDSGHIALADALSELGGISVMYQRAHEAGSAPQLAVGADLIFGFAPSGYQTELGSGSRFRYHVAVGYCGDGRFRHLRLQAQEVRDRLMRNGASHIVTYFDENTIIDGRWFHGHDVAGRNYSFWLEKLLADPQLGLIFKPKRPVNLRQRLGPVAALLKRAEKTGRCFVFEGGLLQGAFPPAVAALASDISVHEALSAGTAGLEAALAGGRTILMDLEGWPRSPLYRLGSEVVFKDWPAVWSACNDYFRDPGSRSGLGDWSSMISELDPFHDGRAAERMSIYLKDLLEGLRRGETPATVMDMAAERYGQRWGKDKVQRGPHK